MGFLSSLIAPAIGLAGSIFGASSAKSGQESANASNAEQAALNREFQNQQANKQWRRIMNASRTEYSRAMKDMRNAGLNPILAYQQGGAHTSSPGLPTGAQAIMQNENALSSQLISQGISSAGDLYAMSSEIEKREAETALIREKVLNEPIMRDINRAIEDKTYTEITNMVRQGLILDQELPLVKEKLTIMARTAEQAGITTEMLRQDPALGRLAALAEILGLRASGGGISIGN